MVLTIKHAVCSVNYTDPKLCANPRLNKEMIKGVSPGVSIIIKLVLCCPLVTFCMSRILYVGTTQVVVLIYKPFRKKKK